MFNMFNEYIMYISHYMCELVKYSNSHRQRLTKRYSILVFDVNKNRKYPESFSEDIEPLFCKINNKLTTGLSQAND